MEILFVGTSDKAYDFLKKFELSKEELKEHWDLFLVKDYNCPSSQDRGIWSFRPATTGLEKKKDDSILSYVVKCKLSDAEKTPVACVIEPVKYPNRESIEPTNFWRNYLANVTAIKYI